MELAVIDIGGTSIKFARWDGEQLQDRFAEPTPKDLGGFYDCLTAAVVKMKAGHNLKGVAISSPGAVNQATGVIEGASALPYIHNFPIQPELEQRFGLPMAFENDANCAALAEVKSGAAVGKNRVAMLVLGTGVGGALIADGKVEHGAHLLGGEFGFMLQNGRSVSEQATVVHRAEAYAKRTGEKITGEEMFQRAANGDRVAHEEVEGFYEALAQVIFNLQYSYDPELFLLGGGVSRNPELLPGIERHMVNVFKAIEIASQHPVIKICHYAEAANLIGAVANFEQRHPEE